MLVKGSIPDALKNAGVDSIRESLRRSLALRVPRNAEELWRLIGYRLGLWFGRHPVCEDHDAPFDFIRDAFFQTYDRIMVLAAKATGKTASFAVVHELNSEYKPGCWTAHMGAVEKQAYRCYDYVDGQLKMQGLVGRTVEPYLYEVSVDGMPLRSSIKWRNGSRLEVLAGTIGQASGPHPQIAAVDEFELLEWVVWAHFSKTPHESPAARAQMLIGSTRFKARGPMQRLLDEKADVFRIVKFCIYDAMARCNRDCMNVDERGFKGQCPLYERKELQPDGSTEVVPMCHGRAHQADGHLTWQEVVTAWMLSDPVSWAVVMELRKPGSEGLFFPELDTTLEGRHIREEYEYVPGQPVYLGFDDGFAYPHCLGAWQERSDGLLYQFDEMYGTQKLPIDLCEDLKTKDWLEDVEGGWPDPSARAAIEEFNRFFRARLGRSIMSWQTDNDRANGWKAVRKRLWGPRGVPMIGWHPRCRNTYKDVAGLARLEGTEDCKKENDHGADQTRYLVFNLDKMRGRHAAREEENRREGAWEKEERVNAAKIEGTIKERWDKLVDELGVSQAVLVDMERRYDRDRRGLLKALGEWISENTIQGRLRRAGLVDDEEE